MTSACSGRVPDGLLRGECGCPDLDPAWEYFSPDPYVEWAVYGHRPRAACGFDALFDIDEDEGWSRHRNRGLRFGRGKPDGFWGRLAPDPDRRKAPRETLQPVKCKGCGRVFQPARSGAKHCSNECYKHPGRARTLPESVECSVCGRAFRPAWTGNVVCGKACAARLGGPKVREIDTARFASLWRAGASRAEIAAALGMSEPTVKRWVKRLGLKKRAVGNHSRAGRSRRWGQS